MRILIYLFFIIGLASPLWGEESQVPKRDLNTLKDRSDVIRHEISPFDLWRWRALEAEIKVIQLEANEAMQKKIEEKKKLEETWRKRFNIESLEGWVIDIWKSEIRKEIKEK